MTPEDLKPTNPQEPSKPASKPAQDDADRVEQVAEERIQEEIDDNRRAAK